MEETYNNAKREVEEFASDVRQGVDDFVSDVKQEVDEFVDNVQQGAEELVDEITEFVEDTKEAAEEFMEETKEKLEVTGQAIAETVKGMSPMELAHTTLDMVGMIPVAGEFCDAANALLYLAEKDYGNAAMSAAACIPGWGNAATGAKWIGKGANAVDVIADTAKALDKAMDTVEAISDGTRVASNIADVSGAIVDGSKAVGNVAGNIPTLELPKGNFAKELYEGMLGFVSMPFVKLGDNIDTAADTAKAMDKLNDAEKAGDALDAVGDVSKRTDDLADAAKKVDTAPAKSNGADDVVENVNDAAKPKETLEEVGKIEDNGGVEAEIKRVDKMEVEFNYNSKYDEEEFARQLADQQKGMNELTVQEYMDNRQSYIDQGRAVESNAAQQAAREKAFVDKVDELQDTGLSLQEAEEQAQKWMETQAALHNPDQVAGGYAGSIGGVGDKSVNFSIGSQWRYRIDALDEQIKHAIEGMSADDIKSIYLNVNLKYKGE